MLKIYGKKKNNKIHFQIKLYKILSKLLLLNILLKHDRNNLIDFINVDVKNMF